MRMAVPTFSLICVHSGNYTALIRDFLMLCISILPYLAEQLFLTQYPNWYTCLKKLPTTFQHENDPKDRKGNEDVPTSIPNPSHRALTC